MKKSFKIYSIIAMFVMMVMQSCAFVNPNYDEEVSFMKRPIFFGTTGVDDVSANSFSTYVLTTEPVYFKILPIKKDFKFDDLLSNDNTPLDVNINLVYQIRKGQSPYLLRNYGANWFENFIEPYFRNKVREYVSSYSPFDLMSNREIIMQFDKNLQQSMNEYIQKLTKEQGLFPVVIKQIITDRVMPNREQLIEMNKTAAAIQAKQTQEKKAEMETARAKAETARALADKAYMQEMNLTASQFIQLRQWEVIERKSGANIDVLVGSNEVPMWNIRK